MRMKLNKTKKIEFDLWAILMLAAAMITTALEGTGVSAEELTSWSIVFTMVSNLFGNPYKLVTVALVAVAFFFPRPHVVEDDEGLKSDG